MQKINKPYKGGNLQMKNYLTKQEAIKCLEHIRINSEQLNVLDESDRITIISKTKDGAEVQYQSCDYDMIKELYEDNQKNGAYCGTITIVQSVRENLKMVKLKGTEEQIIQATAIKEFVTNEIFDGMNFDVFTAKDIKTVLEIQKDLGNDKSIYWINKFHSIEGNNLTPILKYLNKKDIAGKKICNEINKKYGVKQ